MSELKKAIFSEVRKVHDASAMLSDDQINSIMFKIPNKLLLTFPGFLILKNIFTVYSFELPDTLKARHKMGMSTFVYPYFLTKRRLILFSDQDAMIIKLYGSVEGFLENCYQVDLNKVSC